MLAKGQRFEFVNVTMGTVTEYELAEFETPGSVMGAIAQLRNIETGGMARVTCRWLMAGVLDGFSHWRPCEA